ncbi:ankyrin repeat-containing domain protein, partial [Baffinella frigidus]
LWMASAHGRKKEVSRLLLEGAEIDEPGGGVWEWTPLQAAASRGHSLTALLLLEHGASLAAKAKDGGTALVFACLGAHPEVASLLLAKGAEATAEDDRGRTALHAAAFSKPGRSDAGGRQEVARLLL